MSKENLITREVNKKGFRGKINAKCIECVYDPYSTNGTWRQQVELCTSSQCPLYPIRPTSNNRKDKQQVDM